MVHHEFRCISTKQNCICCNESPEQKISLSKPHPLVIQIIANNNKNNVAHRELAKNIMKSLSFAVKLVFNWLEKNKPLDEISFDTYTIDTSKNCSTSKPVGGHFGFYVVYLL